MVGVIGAGFGRTGTMSLHTALALLGFGPVFHMGELYDRPERLGAWRDAAAGRESVGRAVAGYASTLGWPGCAFVGDLVRAFPRARVVLTDRDPEAWYRSAYRTLYLSRFDEQGRRRRLEGDTAQVAAFAEELIWDGAFHGRFEERSHALSVFSEHRERVIAAVPGDRLLVFRAEEGWGPLCSFLGVPVPGTPYPRSNGAADFHARVRRRIGRR
ncbi:sulfotransferase family protein [Nocardiopsis halophila]|uniref:sulfotransferase family protein n=1 Tax=Nocardiopsis halophila TaxID=141692 RepID=UPI00034C913E|nr:sulfotransferase family protein [Nocardiopsis halophila]